MTLNLLFTYWGSRCKKKGVAYFFLGLGQCLFFFFLFLPASQQTFLFGMLSRMMHSKCLET